VSAAADDPALHARAAALEGEVLRSGEAPGAAGQAGHGEVPPAGPSTGELLAALLKPTFAVMAPAWGVTDDECALLGNAYGAVIDKYFPNFDFGVEFSALLVTLAVFGPRFKKPMRNTQQPAADAAAPEAG